MEGTTRKVLKKDKADFRVRIIDTRTRKSKFFSIVGKKGDTAPRLRDELIGYFERRGKRKKS